MIPHAVRDYASAFLHGSEELKEEARVQHSRAVGRDVSPALGLCCGLETRARARYGAEEGEAAARGGSTGRFPRLAIAESPVAIHELVRGGRDQMD